MNTFSQRLYAILIGVDNYLHPLFPNLPATTHDVQALATILTDPFHCGYLPSNVRQIYGEYATATNIREALQDVAVEITSDATVLIYFSGHGGRSLENDHWQVYLCPREANPADLAHTAISGDEFSSLLAAIPSSKLVVILDACHAGGATKFRASESSDVWRAGLTDVYFQALSQGNGRVVIASSKENQASWNRSGNYHGLFTWCLLAGLKGEASVYRDGFVRVLDLYHYISQQVKNQQPNQEPILHVKDVDNNFPIALARVSAASQQLAKQLRVWFETLGYHFEDHDLRTEHYFEWIIKVPLGRRRYNFVLVRGIEGEIGIRDVLSLREAVDNQDTDEGWIVTARRVSQASRDAVKKEENSDLFCYTFDELIDESADFSGYLDWLEAEIKLRGIDKMYVPLACTKEEFDPVTKQKIGESRYDERNGWIDHYIDLWLADPSKEHISILGEFGTGKTWFALHYAWRVLQDYRKAKELGIERPRLPLFVPLRDYAKAVSIQSLFSEFFFRKHEIPLPGYTAFEQLNRMGKLLLIFDGFDEMADRVDRQKMINNFWELARVVVPGAKAILTCRTEHFPEALEGRTLLNAELQASTAYLTGEPPQFEVLELNHFNDSQIRSVLSFRAEPTTIERIMSNSQLLDLARRPVMAELILDALPEIRAGKPIDLSRVYLYAVRHKMERDIREERTFTSLADKLFFMCELSWEMLSSDQMSLNYRLFPDRLRHLFGHTVHEQKNLDHWHYDMMGQTMLIRNADGDYTPAHRSLLEFFIAYKFAAELGVLASDFTELARTQSHLNEDNSPQTYTWSSYFRRQIDEKGAFKLISPLQRFVPESIDKLVMTIGKISMNNAILDLIQNMLHPDKERVKGILEAIIVKTRGKITKEVGYVGGNIATLLVHCDPLALKGRDLSMTNLNHADLGGADLTSCNLNGANLQYIQFRNTTLRNADLRGSDLTGSRFAEMKDVRSVAFSSNGEMLASGGDDTYVHLWEVGTGRELRTLFGHKLDIHRVVFDRLGYFLGIVSDDLVQIWNIQDISLIRTILPKEFSFDYFKALCFHPKNPQEITIGGSSGLVTINLSTKTKFFWRNITQPVYTLEYSPDGQYLAAGLYDSSFSFLNLKTQSASRTFRAGGRVCLDLSFSKEGNHIAVFWSREEKDLTIRNGLVKIYLTQRTTDLSPLYSAEHWQGNLFPSNRMEFLSDGKFIAIAGIDDNIAIIDLALQVCIMKFIGHKDLVTTISLSPDNTFLASGSLDGSIKFWDARRFVSLTGEPYINMTQYSHLDISTLTLAPSTWPEWWQKCKIDPPEGMIPNPSFGRCLRTIEQKLNCQGLQLKGSRGLNAIVQRDKWYRDIDVTLGEWLTERGAVLKSRYNVTGRGEVRK